MPRRIPARWQQSKRIARSTRLGASQEREQRERRQPMLPHIVARYMWKARDQVNFCRAQCCIAPRTIRRPCLRDRPPAPGATEVESIEVGDFSIAPIAD